MTEKEAQKEIQRLAAELHRHNALYYIKDQPQISDFEFDKMLEHLVALETQFPQFKLADSPSQRVGGGIVKEFASVTHQYPMLSLGNTYSEEELRDFDQRIAKGLEGAPYEYFCELKFDGVSLSMIYEKGLLVRGVTRGDGVRGDDVTTNVRTIRTVPLKVTGKNFPDKFEVRGEAFLSKQAFAQLNKAQEEQGEETYANARNTASGTLKMQDSSIVASRKLACYAYYLLGENLGTETHEQGIKNLEQWGFNVSPTYKKCRSIEEVLDYIKTWEQKRHDLELETDGVVIKINNLAQQQQLGFTAKSPRWAIAFKYKAESASTKLNSITYQVGRTGAITPVAELQPVLLAGTTVKRASLHNANEIERLDLRLGDLVFVEKGGEIIPKVTGVAIEKRSKDSQPIQYISVCPECGTSLVRTEGEAAHYCPNINGCPPQIKGRIEHFIARKAMDINSLGERTIDSLFQLGLVKSPADLFDLKKEDIQRIEGFKELSTQNLLQGIEKAKATPFEAVLFAIGIRYVGKTVAEKLARHFRNIEAIANASREALLAAPEIGEKIADSLLHYFAQAENQKEIARLKAAGLHFEVSGKEPEKVSNALEGKTFLASGVFKNFSRDGINEAIEAHGGKVLSGVSGKLNYLVAGDNMGPSKKEKAEKLGVKIISEEEFERMIGM